MAEIQKSWDDIPTVGDLAIDWEYKAESPLGKRKHERMTSQDVTTLFGVKAIRARVATAKQTIDGVLSDIGAGGIALILKKGLTENQDVKIGFYLGKKKIISKAVVKRSAPIQKNYRVGFQFQDINEDHSSYINSLYATKRLNRV